MLSNMQLLVHHKCEGSCEEQTKPCVSCLFCNVPTSSVAGNRGIKGRLWDIRVWQCVTVHNKVSIQAMPTLRWWIRQIQKAWPMQWQATIPSAVLTNIWTLSLWELLWQSWNSLEIIIHFQPFCERCHFFNSVNKYLMIEIYHNKWLAVPECWPIRVPIENVLVSDTMYRMYNTLEYIRSLLGTSDLLKDLFAYSYK